MKSSKLQCIFAFWFYICAKFGFRLKLNKENYNGSAVASDHEPVSACWFSWKPDTQIAVKRVMSFSKPPWIVLFLLCRGTNP